MDRKISLNNWIFNHKNKIDEIIDLIIYRLKNNIMIPDSFNVEFFLNEDNLRKQLINYIYINSNSSKRQLLLSI